MLTWYDWPILSCRTNVLSLHIVSYHSGDGFDRLLYTLLIPINGNLGSRSYAEETGTIAPVP